MLSDADKTSLHRQQLQKLYVASGNAKVTKVVEQVKASLDEGGRVLSTQHLFYSQSFS